MFYPELFPSAMSHFLLSRANTSTCVFTPREHVFLRAGSWSLVVPFRFPFHGGLFRLRGIRFRPGCVRCVARCAARLRPFFRFNCLSVFPVIRASRSEVSPPVIWGIRLSRRFRSSLYPLPGPQSPLSDQGLMSASFRGLSGDRIYTRSRFNYVNCTAIIVSSVLTAHTS